MISETDLRWVTGFTEGDGSIMVLKRQPSHGREYIRIAYGHKDRQPLDFISHIFSGNVHQHCNGHYELSYNYIKTVPLMDTFSGRTSCQHFTERLNVALQFLSLPSPDCVMPNIDWLAGFWDAEGWSSNKPSIEIEQKEHKVLRNIQFIFGGKICSYWRSNHRTRQWQQMFRWFLTGDKVQELGNLIIPKSHYDIKSKQLLNNINGQTYYQLHCEHIKQRTRKYEREHRGQIKMRAMIYRKSHKEKIQAYMKSWWEANKARINTNRRVRSVAT